MFMHFWGAGRGGYQGVLWEMCKWQMGHSEVALRTGSVKFQTILWDCFRGVTQFPATLLLVEASVIVNSRQHNTQYKHNAFSRIIDIYDFRASSPQIELN